MKIPASLLSLAKNILLVDVRGSYKRRQHQKILNQLKTNNYRSHKISILLPIYNTEHGLEKCLDSILQQTYSDFEIICVNDTSIYNTKQIIGSYSQKDTRISIVDKSQNQGFSFACRDALAQAMGSYVLCIDSDDWIEPTMLEDLYLFAQQSSSYDMVYCDYYKNNLVTYVPTILEKNLPFERIKKRSFSFGNMLWNRLIKKDIFEKVIFHQESMGEDDYISTQLYYLSNTIAYLCKPLYHYNQFSKPDSISC
ncbi:glycosyltransferase family 2 protein [Lactococcus formosensis]|uniref:glycosyltransferase family 2 protein n=1 Tax=Lactococcus formosensis TaxID=1281486 RepID=UPI002434D2BA|nr:glycosyltransferase family 2 protein [Lactococcus formosensis]MDG6120387.1 glycosyltransferase family 2 protein [Lactococcus formosensis]